MNSWGLWLLMVLVAYVVLLAAGARLPRSRDPEEHQ